MDQRGGARGEMKGPRILVSKVGEILLNLPHLGEQLPRLTRQPKRLLGRDDVPPGADEQLRVQLHRQVVQLQTDGAGRKVELLGGPRDALILHDAEKHLDLPDIHGALPLNLLVMLKDLF